MGVENNTPEGWTDATLGDLAERVTKGTTPKSFLFDGNAVNYIKSDSLSYGGFIDVTKIVKISEIDHEKLKRSQLKENDILLSMTGAYLGKTGLVKKEYLPANTNQNVAIISTNPYKIYHFFLWYLLRNKKSVQYYNSIQSESAQPNLNFQEIRSLTIKLPPLTEQKAIAKVLTAFDDKIELLKAQNKTLETMAQTIFKEWFGKYQIGDELPEGWRVGRLKDLGNIICGKTPSKADNENFGGNIPFIKIPDMHNQMFITKTKDSLTKKGVSLQKNKLIPKNSICVSCIATVGLVSITSKDSQTNQQINSIIPFNDSYKEFIYFKVKGLNKYLHDIGSGGTATLNVNTTSFSNIEIVIPDAKKLYSFSKIANPIFKKVLDNNSQIQSLTKTRDTLLPKLMSGQVRVKNLKQTADA